ncbi:putative F-box protein At4g05475 [Bidens hawaiensis]|uniref:putative F-box protein At4g05475 n=1 Tax=Bidens hawaiensis TaxID=980011 RepID=UPI00404B5216
MMMNQPKAIKLETRNWLDLPSDVTANILHRVGVEDVLVNAQNICTAWREICKDPAMWRVVYMDAFTMFCIRYTEMYKHVIDRSQGQLVDVTIVEICNNEILEYIANRFSQLKRLTVECFDSYMKENWTVSLKKFPLLEELSVDAIDVKDVDIVTAGLYCPMLKKLKLNQAFFRCRDEYFRYWVERRGFWDDQDIVDDEIAMGVGQHLHELTHLELMGSTMSNEGLKMILDGCHQLLTLDLRGCYLINLDGDLGRRCLQQIKCVKRPNDAVDEFTCTTVG